MIKAVGFIGYGEVGQIFAADLSAMGIRVYAYDVKSIKGDEAQLREHARLYNVNYVSSISELVSQVDLVISAVTASQTIDAARACAIDQMNNKFFLDVNSASPKTKQMASVLIDAVGGKYVEAAVMTSVPPYRTKVPMLLGGKFAMPLVMKLEKLGFDAKFYSIDLGLASATKMCRSILIKGMEALVVECFTTARGYKVEDAVISSLHETFPGLDWEDLGNYFYQRVIQHGRRRSEEVFEVANTINEIDLIPFTAPATASLQAHMADLADQKIFRMLQQPDWRNQADCILANKSLGKK